ncbi:hypothetical protein SESBI_06604 [Sesbania bispinosa]|nr:hypothetical protein SESBI_06604 [Sesbania bispinosa]
MEKVKRGAKRNSPLHIVEKHKKQPINGPNPKDNYPTSPQNEEDYQPKTTYLGRLQTLVEKKNTPTT